MTARYFEATEATWPAARTWRAGPWTIRDGAGGGKRVSAATLDGHWVPDDIATAEAEMAALGQEPLFMVRDGEADLDAALAARGYQVVDPVWIYAAPITTLAKGPLPHATAMPCWPPLAIERELWAQGGIGPARIAVMDRASAPKTSILGRTKDLPAGVAFVAIHGQIAMIHAIEVTPALRRHGVARNMMWAAAHWAQHQGALEIALLVTQRNFAANPLYTSLGLQIVGQYHYRGDGGFSPKNA